MGGCVFGRIYSTQTKLSRQWACFWSAVQWLRFPGTGLSHESWWFLRGDQALLPSHRRNSKITTCGSYGSMAFIQPSKQKGTLCEFPKRTAPMVPGYVGRRLSGRAASKTSSEALLKTKGFARNRCNESSSLPEPEHPFGGSDGGWWGDNG